MNYLKTAILVLLAHFSTQVSAQSKFIGENLLSLTGSEFSRATGALAERRIATLLRTLKISKEEGDTFPRAGELEVFKLDGPGSFSTCRNRLIIAKENVAISFSNDCIVIASGSVEIAHASNTVIISANAIHVSHDGSRGSSGIYVTKGVFTLSHGKSPYIYAVGGSIGAAPSMTTFNTHVEASGSTIYPQATHYTIEPIFRDEPRPSRLEIGKSYRLDASEFIEYNGKRCIAAKPDNQLFAQILPFARKESSCDKLTSASVVCIEGLEFSEKNYAELWTFEACNKVLKVHFTGHRSNLGKSGGSALIGESMFLEQSFRPEQGTSKRGGSKQDASTIQ